VDFPFPCLITRGQEYCPFGKKIGILFVITYLLVGFHGLNRFYFKKPTGGRRTFITSNPKSVGNIWVFRELTLFIPIPRFVHPLFLYYMFLCFLPMLVRKLGP
jgi:hypothetical protein